MSEAEAIELVAALASNALAAFTVHFSFTFAYLTAAYFVGATLSKFQAVSSSILYVLLTSSTGATLLGTQRGIAKIQELHPSVVIDEMVLWDMGHWHVFTVLVFVAVMILSLYFMHHSRRLGKRN